ncbi:fructose 1,6-bisphosphatase [Lacinutrix sp. MedPE-SW]|uniref:fructose 1,6-bisphosphatase n=1 Tax=Lacinutrix sp. MedPE-SW TaxID=1860087 RepID=UPI000910E62E|nr:fructose 1,6-bisphosphatase [Lacinutrix sp. MedPE-SW]OIQ23302.1 MAG: fructose 1,6-bisphosphatase [Lacinutrix sp. MedPE-SW]
MAKDAKTNPEITNAQDPTSKIDAIKQLIFGENMVEYNHEFEAVKQDILNKKKELENLVDEVKAELLQNIDNLSTDINIRITELENNLEDKANSLDEKKLDRKIFGDLLIKLGEKISN